MRRHKTGLKPFTVGVLALLVTVVVCYLGFSKSIPFRQHFEVQGVFNSSNNIGLNSPVRVAGVTVGKVVKVDHAKDGSQGAVVTMRINKRGRPIRKDARLTIRPRIFLEGNFFVDVSPGTPSSPELGDGDVIPINQTSAPVQLDQILTALQSDTRDDLRVVLRELATGVDGKGGEGFNRSIPYWKEAYRDSALVADASLGEAEHDLSQYIASAGVVAGALDRSPEALKALITDFNTTARAFAREDQNLRAAVAELPRTLRAAQPALGALNASFPGLRGLARDLRPGVRNSEAAIDASLPLVKQLRGLVSESELRGLTRDLRPTVPDLTALSDATVPFYAQARRLSSCQNEVILPWSVDTVKDNAHPAAGKVFEEAPKAFVGLSGESRSGDSNGQWFRVLVAGGTNLITLRPGVFATSALPINGSNPPRPTTRPPLNADAPCESQQPPNLASEPGPPPPQRRVDTSTPQFQAQLAKDKAAAVKWLTKQLQYEGLSDEISVAAEDVTAGEIAKLAEKTKLEQAASRRRILGAIGR
jgi:virulence factor Mce-like protein